MTNHELVKYFKAWLTHPTEKDSARQRFKEYVNTLATIKQENGEKYLVLKKRFYPHFDDDEGGGAGGGSSLLDEVMGALPPQSSYHHQPQPAAPPPQQQHHQRRALPPTPSAAALPQPYHRPVPPPGDLGLPVGGYHQAPSQRSSYASVQRGSTGSGKLLLSTI